MRNKRSSFLINLIETPNGFSLIQGTQILNKPAVIVQKLVTPPPAPSTAIPNSTIPMASFTKQLKNVYKKVNLIFPKGTNNSNRNLTLMKQRQSQKLAQQKSFEEQEHKVIQEQVLNPIELNISKISKAGDFVEWFDMQKVHQKQISQIKIWYAQQNPNQDILKISKTDQQIRQNNRLNKYIQKYKKHRNTIIHLYYKDHYQNGTYLTVSQVRKRIPFDAYWLMKIHVYLCNNFIINFNTLDYDHEIGSHQYLYKLNLVTGKYQMLKNQLSMLRENDLKIKKFPQTPQEQNQALKLITSKIRPYCDYCGIHCGIVWFHHFKQVDSKQISVIMKNVNSKNPPLSEKPYQMILCTRCYCDGNFPILLTHHDFKKMTVNDKLEPNKKRKLKKKKKQKKRKQKLQRMHQNDHGNQRMQEKEQQYYEEQLQQKYFEQQKNQQEKNQQEKLKQQINHNITGHNEKQQEAAQHKQEKQEVNVAKMIENILNTLEKPKFRTLQQTLRLVQLVEKYEQNWGKIKSELQKQGYFENCTILQLINFFVSLPKRNVSKLREEYEPEQFLMQNYKSNKNSVSDLIAQRTLNRAINLQKKVSMNSNRNEKQIKTQFLWKQNLDRFINLQIQRISNRVQYLQTCEDTSKDLMRKIAKPSQLNKHKY